MNCDTWVSKFMGLIYPWHRSGLCSHYLYPTNIGATQLQAPGFNRLPCLLGRDHPGPFLHQVGSCLEISYGRGERRENNYVIYLLLRDVDQPAHLTICRGKWSSSAAPAAPFKRPTVRPSLEMVREEAADTLVGLGETRLMISITIQMISSDKLQIIIQWFPPPGQGQPPLSLVHHSTMINWRIKSLLKLPSPSHPDEHQDFGEKIKCYKDQI